MKARILVAVDDRAPWTKHRAALPDEIEMVLAESAREALEKLSKQGPFAVLVAELRVPGMSGLDVLATARQHMPDTARILVVDGEDREAAIEAVNQARVQAIFVQPFSSEVFATAVREGVACYQRTCHERAVALQSAEGVVQLLTGLVHPSIPIPPISEASQRMRDRVRLTAQALKLPTVADLETAAMLSRVALAAVPRHILDKLLTHDRLTPGESELLARLPDMGLNLVESQPRFAGVAEIFRQQGADPGAMTIREDGVREPKIPLASRILRAVVDLHLHENAGLTIAAALAEMRRKSVHYDPTVLKTLEILFAGPTPASNATFEECMVSDLTAGCVLATDALSHEGVALVSAGTAITSAVLDRLRNFTELGEVTEPLYIIRESREAGARSAEGAMRGVEPE